MRVIFNFQHPRGYVESVVTDDGALWRLEGECNQCGDCCRLSLAPTEYRNPDGSCSQLIDEIVNDKPVAECKLFWNRPMSCALYPLNPLEPLPPNCSYKWVEAD